MTIILKYDKTSSKSYQAEMEWLAPDGHVCTTMGVSDHSYEEAIGNLIKQLSANKDHYIYLAWIKEDGTKEYQPKM